MYITTCMLYNYMHISITNLFNCTQIFLQVLYKKDISLCMLTITMFHNVSLCVCLCVCVTTGNPNAVSSPPDLSQVGVVWGVVHALATGCIEVHKMSNTV